MQTILHVLEKQEWESALAKGFYASKSLKTDKFIHCSTKKSSDWCRRFFI